MLHGVTVAGNNEARTRCAQSDSVVNSNPISFVQEIFRCLTVFLKCACCVIGNTSFRNCVCTELRNKKGNRSFTCCKPSLQKLKCLNEIYTTKTNLNFVYCRPCTTPRTFCKTKETVEPQTIEDIQACSSSTNTPAQSFG